MPNLFAWRDGAVKRDNHFLLPQDIRALIVGKSNSGKTCTLFHLLLTPGLLDYDNLYVCGKSLHQLEYRIISAAFSRGMSKSQIVVLFARQGEIDDPVRLIEEYEGPVLSKTISVHYEDDVSNVPDPREFSPNRKNLVVLDDVMLSSQSNIERFFVRGRHNAINVFYIAQNYFRLPRSTVRENSNFFILFHQDGKCIQHIWQDLCSTDMTLDEFRSFCDRVWKVRHNFVTIDLQKPAHCGRFRQNLDTFYIPTKYQPDHCKMDFREVHTAQDEVQLLSEIIRLDTEVRKKKERERLTSLKRSAEYEKIFNPITRTMVKLMAPTPPAGDNLEDEVEPVGDAEDEGGEEDEVKVEVKEEPPEPSSYEMLLKKIKNNRRESGNLGLKADGTIAGHPYEVHGDTLSIKTEAGLKTFTITDPEVWRMLLLQKPHSGEKDGVLGWRQIMTSIPRAEPARTRRAKAKLLDQGGGYLFSTLGPKLMPRGKQPLLKALAVALAETRAGNEGMRDSVVQLAREAKRRKILPKALLSKEELLWTSL